MPVRIRLRRVGRKKQPSYRIVVAEGQSPRNGVYVDNVGFYNPRQDPAELKIDLEKVDQWIERGAQVSPTVKSLIRKARQGSSDVVAPKGQAAEAAVEAAPVVEAAAAEATVEEAEGAGETAEASQE